MAKYSEYLKLNDYQDDARLYNCGFAANQAKNYTEAAKYFNMCIEKNYNVDDCYVGIAMAYRNLDKTPEFLSAVEAGLKVAKEGNNKTNLEKLLYVYCMKEGQAAQKAGKIDEAEKLFSEVLLASNKTYQGNAYYSLGAMFYNKGATKLQEITPLATSDADKYNAEKPKADADLKKAKEYLTKALEVNPADANSKKIMDSINATLK